MRSPTDGDLSLGAARVAEGRQRILAELRKVIVGQDEVVEQVLIALFTGGHCLITGVPGLAKTLLIRTLADILDQAVHLMAQPGWHFGVAIQYDDGPDHLSVAHTGLPGALLAFDRDDGTTPWGRACATGAPVYDIGL